MNHITLVVSGISISAKKSLLRKVALLSSIPFLKLIQEIFPYFESGKIIKILMVQQKEPWNYVTQNKNYIIISIGNCGIFVSCYCSFYNQNCMSISEHYLVGHPEEIASADNYYGHTFTHSLIRKMDIASSSLLFTEGDYHVLYQRKCPDAVLSGNTYKIAVRSYQCVNKNKSGKSRL